MTIKQCLMCFAQTIVLDLITEHGVSLLLLNHVIRLIYFSFRFEVYLPCRVLMAV